MDTNGDGVITRSEWRGNDNSFRNQDWNGDGILSGDEVRPARAGRPNWSQDWNRDGRVDNLDSQIAQRFRGYDMNSDNRVGTQRVARRRAPVHAPRRESRRLPLDAGIHAGRRVHARFARWSVIPVLEHRHQRRRLGHAQRMEHEQRRLQPARRESRQPHQPVRVRERHRGVQRLPLLGGAVQRVRRQSRWLAHAGRIRHAHRRIRPSR